MPCRWSSSRPITSIGVRIGAIRSRTSFSLIRGRTYSAERICISSMSRRLVSGFTVTVASVSRSRNSWLAGSQATPAVTASGYAEAIL